MHKLAFNTLILSRYGINTQVTFIENPDEKLSDFIIFKKQNRRIIFTQGFKGCR